MVEEKKQISVSNTLPAWDGRRKP